MIDIFEVLGWLEAIDRRSCLNDESGRLARYARLHIREESSVKAILERLRNTAHSSNNPIEKAETLFHCAAIEYYRSRYPQATRDAQEAIIFCDHDDHCHAIGLWILGMTQWKTLQNHDAYRNCAEAREIFAQCQTLFQGLDREVKWYTDRKRQMDVELITHPEKISTWLNHFEVSSLRSATQQVVHCMQEKVRQQAYPSIYVLMQDLQEAIRQSEGLYERAEVYFEFGLAMYQMGNTYYAIELLRKSVQDFFPGLGSYHKQTIARCLLGSMEWLHNPPHNQALADWKHCLEEFDSLRQWASIDNNQIKEKWYAEQRYLLSLALLERLAEAKTSRKQNPKPPKSRGLDGSMFGESHPKPPPSTPTNQEPDLYNELLMKVGWDRAKAERLIEYERKNAPTADRNEWIKRAIEHWNRDNH